VSNLQVTPITGLPQVNSWAQVVSHPSRLLTCVISVSGKNANSVGKTLTEQVTHFQISDSAQLHNDLLDLLQRARSEECQLQLAAVLFADSKSAAATNSGSVFLKRNHRIGEILTSDGELKIVEGTRQTEDVFVLVTHQAKSLFPELKNVLHQETEDLVPQLVTELHSKENSALSAMAWVENNPALDAESAMEAVTASKTLSPKRRFLNFGSIVRTVKHRIPSRLLKNPVYLLKRLGRKTQTALSALRQPSNNILGKKPPTLTKNFSLYAGVVVLLLGGIILLKRFQINQEVNTLQPRLGELQQQLAHAQSIAESEPITAREEARAVLQGLEDLIAANPDKKQAIKKLKEEYQIAQAFAESIAGTETQNLEPFFDLRLAEASFVAKEIALSDNTLLALDAAGQRVVLLDLTTKQTQQIIFDNIGSGKSLSSDQDTLYVLADGLHAYDLKSESHPHTLLKAQGDSDRAGIFLQKFATYLYVLNPAERNIFRYLQNTDGLSDPVGWLVDKQGLDFSVITAMTIDGDLWLTTQDGQILKYTQGQPQVFTVGEQPTPFDSALEIATHPDSEYLLVLEKAHQRVVILRKDGSFYKEIVSSSLASAETIAASLTENAAYVVSGSLVYKITF